MRLGINGWRVHWHPTGVGRDVLTTGGHALLLPAAEVEPLAEAMLRIAHERELHRQLSESGREFVQQFTWELTARATLEALWEAAQL